MIIHNQKLRDAVLTTLGDKEMVQIMNFCMYNAASVSEVIKETGIPHTSAYRKIKWMLENGILIIDHFFISPEGKKTSLFKSILRSISVNYEANEIKITAEYNIDPLSKAINRFFSLED